MNRHKFGIPNHPMTRKSPEELSQFFKMSQDGETILWEFNTVQKGGHLLITPRMASREGEPAGCLAKHPKGHSRAGEPAWLKIFLFGAILRGGDVAYCLQTGEEIPDDCKVVHRDGDPTNNNIKNLVVIKKLCPLT